eukprot:scaffold101928_cov24-Tisochrysis_lutea.AAC.1
MDSSAALAVLLQDNHHHMANGGLRRGPMVAVPACERVRVRTILNFDTGLAILRLSLCKSAAATPGRLTDPLALKPVNLRQMALIHIPVQGCWEILQSLCNCGKSCSNPQGCALQDAQTPADKFEL